MRLSIDDLKLRSLEEDSFSSPNVELIADDTSKYIRGGDKEYNPPLYEQKHQSFWQRASMLLDNIK